MSRTCVVDQQVPKHMKEKQKKKKGLIIFEPVVPPRSSSDSLSSHLGRSAQRTQSMSFFLLMDTTVIQQLATWTGYVNSFKLARFKLTSVLGWTLSILKLGARLSLLKTISECVLCSIHLLSSPSGSTSQYLHGSTGPHAVLTLCPLLPSLSVMFSPGLPFYPQNSCALHNVLSPTLLFRVRGLQSLCGSLPHFIGKSPYMLS